MKERSNKNVKESNKNAKQNNNKNDQLNNKLKNRQNKEGKKSKNIINLMYYFKLIPILMSVKYIPKIGFSRIKRKVNEMYPKFAKKKKDESSSSESEEE